MKVRILGNTIRFRLKQPEVHHFESVGKVTEVIEFGPEASDQIRFNLEIYTGQELAVSFHATTTTVMVPQALGQEWVQTDLVGFNGKVDTGKGRTISILIEKDFMCIDGQDEDNEGAYPNPIANC
jgi:hypothetical protein